MTDTSFNFRLVRHGYDPEQVVAHVGELARQVELAQYDVSELTRLADTLRSENDAYKQKFRSRYGGLGERIEQILALAETEAADIRADAAADAEAVKAKVEKWAASILEDAKREADQIHREAERAAHARREEAEAYFEAVRANAGRLAAEMETTLASRRQQAEQEYEQRLAEVARQEAEAAEHSAQLRAEAQEVRADAERKAERHLEEAEHRGREIVEEAKAAADRARVESDREVAAAIARRDSIDAQLAHLRTAFGALGSLVPALGTVENGGQGRGAAVEPRVVAAPGPAAVPGPASAENITRPVPEVVDAPDGPDEAPGA
jgi:cell division septum initiation protein DivIVA